MLGAVMAGTRASLAEAAVDLSAEERALLSAAFRGSRERLRSAWRVLSQLAAESTGAKRAAASELRGKLGAELGRSCRDALELAGQLFAALPPGAPPDDAVFHLKLRADNLRYLWEISDAPDQTAARRGAEKAYLAASELAGSLPATSPLRLALALNFSVFLREAKADQEGAVHMAREAFDRAVRDVDYLAPDDFHETCATSQLLLDNLTIWEAKPSPDPEQPAAVLAPGAVVGGVFRVLGKLSGDGGEECYRLEDTGSGEVVQLKLAGGRDALADLEREAAALKELAVRGAEHFAQLLHVGAMDTLECLVTSGGAGRTVAEVGAEQRLCVSTALGVGVQCLGALGELHAAGFVHGNVSPQHLVLRPDLPNGLVLRLSARQLRESSAASSRRHESRLPSDLRYAPLSVHEGGEWSKAGDLEAWLYVQAELLSGRLPWGPDADAGQVSRLKARSWQDVSLWADCPDQLASVLGSALRYARSLRAQDTPDSARIVRLLNLALPSQSSDRTPSAPPAPSLPVH